MNTQRCSFEFFPPRSSAGVQQLQQVQQQLLKFDPEYFSVTYGAGGATRDKTLQTVLNIHHAGHKVAPHLSFGVDDENTIKHMLQQYKNEGISRLVALRGDLPSGMGSQRMIYANELVAFARDNFAEHFHISVACYPEVHPQASGYREDVSFLKQKLEAGADDAITQYFYNIDSMSYFLDECGKQGISNPIIPGIMPITKVDNLLRFSKACGAEIPKWLEHSLNDKAEDNESLVAYGVEVVTKLCEQLQTMGLNKFHFYSMNKAEPTSSICQNLELNSKNS